MVISQCADCHVDLYDSGEALLATAERYDIYFLDIQMPGISGTEAAQRIRVREATETHGESIIIFITSHTDYWENAFDVRAFHYLVKPVDTGKFETVLGRAVTDCIEKRARAKKHIILKSKDSVHTVLLGDILYVESQNKKLLINTVSGAIEHYGRMQDLENTLGNSFFRCHRCYMVNMEHIEKYNATTIWLKNGSDIFLSSRKYGSFVKAYLNYAKRGGN